MKILSLLPLLNIDLNHNFSLGGIHANDMLIKNKYVSIKTWRGSEKIGKITKITTQYDFYAIFVITANL